MTTRKEPRTAEPRVAAEPRGRGGGSAVVGIALWLLAATTAGAQPGALFPDPFVVEHHVVQRDGDGTVFRSDPVTDYYGGSWIVSVRGDKSRLVVDLARRQLTEIRVSTASYWSLSFDRFAELRERYLKSELGRQELLPEAPVEADPGSSLPGREEPRRLLVREAGPAGGGSSSLAAAARFLPRASAALLERPGVRHLQVTPAAVAGEASRATPGAPATSATSATFATFATFAMEVWVDSRVRLGPPALSALASFESALEASPRAVSGADVAPSRLLAAARSHAQGAFPVRTWRPLYREAKTGRPLGSVEDLATRLDTLPVFPAELVEIPDGLRRVAHPLELVLALVDDEAGREALRGNPVRP